ncbi:hypothetical protein [Amycolatopsis sp. NPDC059657]|uniref:hypothetical protein n=1 Tax=Amycolatopsis sp. NPDC059657 TaxID=3346899 RepID=UPI00366D1042
MEDQGRLAFEAAARSDTDAIDTFTLSTPMIVLRLFGPALALSVYWSVRLPHLVSSAERLTAGLEIGVAFMVTAAGLCLALDAAFRLFNLMRKV